MGGGPGLLSTAGFPGFLSAWSAKCREKKNGEKERAARHLRADKAADDAVGKKLAGLLIDNFKNYDRGVRAGVSASCGSVPIFCASATKTTSRSRAACKSANGRCSPPATCAPVAT